MLTSVILLQEVLSLNTRVVVTRYGGPEVLEVVNEPLRAPQAGEIRVKVQYSGVALADIMRREGKYPLSPTPPFTPGYDAVGVVDELGEGVAGYHNGQRVGVFFNGVGSNAAYVYAQLDEVLPVPPDLDPELIVASILNYVSAYQLLHRVARVSQGERVLIHGASGGVGTALLDLGRLSQVHMYGTASLAKHSVVARYGARPIDYRQEDFVEVLGRLAPEGMDVVFDPIGGPNDQRSLQTLGKKGRFIAYGYTSVLAQGSREDWTKEWADLAEKDTTESGQPVSLYTITSLKQQRLDWFREDAAAVFSLLEKGAIHPLISHCVPLRDAPQAHELLEKSLAVGKVILTHD